jgi:hypothetical protein
MYRREGKPGEESSPKPTVPPDRTKVQGRPVIDAKSFPQVHMPGRDRFVPDDRLESTQVR